MRKKHWQDAIDAYQAFATLQANETQQDRKLEREKLEFEKQKHEDELRVKDRVNVSLYEYEKMKHRLETLESQVKQYENLLAEINFKPELIKAIIPDTVQALSASNIKDGTIIMQIQFEYDPIKLI